MKRLLAEFESVSHQTACPDSDGSLGGGGLAGKAAILNLGKKGIRVICVEPEGAGLPRGRQVARLVSSSSGERSGAAMEQWIGQQMATSSRHLTLKLRDGFFERTGHA
jgi:hypothetical protein